MIINLKSNFKKNGIAIQKKIFPLKLIKEAKNELKKINLKKKNNHIVLDKNFKIKYIKDLDFHYNFFKKFINSRLLLTAKELLNENVYVVNVGLHSKTGKDSTLTPAHQDNFYWSRKPANALTAYIALTKQSKKNGVISYLLGSHKKGVLKHKKSKIRGFSSFISDKNILKKKFFSPKLKPGDVVFHHCNTIHRANPNLLNGIKNSRKSIAIVIYGESALENKKMKILYLKNNPKI
tara:strand:+ start:272 stop:979 length:708 start_codon:yes stop_codon:yes gene_type:complete